MDTGTVVLIIASIIGGVITLALFLWAIVVLIALRIARKASQEARANFQRKAWR